MNNNIKAGLIGHPVGHSKSPLIHNYWIKKYGLKGNYQAIDTLPDALEDTISRLKDEGFAGFNITVPHKQSVMRLCDKLDETATRIKAVNTVRIDENGHLTGMNTDAFGFIQNIKQHAPGFDFTSGPAIVLGAGGAARAIVFALLKEGAPQILLTNRTFEKAQALAQETLTYERIEPVPWQEKESALKEVSLLVNTTPAGMAGMPPLDIELENLPPSALVHDIVYAPMMTELLEKGERLGNPVVTGIGMLLHQARPAFAEWFGVMPDVTPELEEKVLS